MKLARPPHRPLSRRRLLELAAAACGLAAMSGPARSFSLDTPISLSLVAPELRSIRDTLAAAALGWIKDGRLVRDDGWLYAIDVGLLGVYFAGAGDAAAHQTVRDFAVGHLVMDAPNDPQFHRLVHWRIRPDDPKRLDATGTTETLRIAKALWRGAKAFDRPADAALAVEILHGYARHEVVDQGVWLIRNYFSFNTRGYASNSFLVDYDADLVRQVADVTGDGALKKVADDSYEVVRRAMTPAGLIYDLVQPELKTLVPELDLAFFSPNDVCGLANCLTVAHTVAVGAPGQAGRTLDFAEARLADLRKYYYGRTGEPVDSRPAHAFEWATFIRLAAALDRRPTVERAMEKALPQWRQVARDADPRDAYLAAEVLLGIQAALGMIGSFPSPAGRGRREAAPR